MDKNGQLKVGVYVDVSNIALNGGYGMQYDVLREFACRNNGVAIRLNAYVAYDEEMAKRHPDYKTKSASFHSVLRDFGYKVIVKTVRWFTDEQGNRYGKSNADLDMAVDALMQSERLDYVLLVSGDGDFIEVVNKIQEKGKLAFLSCFESGKSWELQKICDGFIGLDKFIPKKSFLSKK